MTETMLWMERINQHKRNGWETLSWIDDPEWFVFIAGARSFYMCGDLFRNSSQDTIKKVTLRLCSIMEKNPSREFPFYRSDFVKVLCELPASFVTYLKMQQFSNEVLSLAIEDAFKLKADAAREKEHENEAKETEALGY